MEYYLGSPAEKPSRAIRLGSTPHLSDASADCSSAYVAREEEGGGVEGEREAEGKGEGFLSAGPRGGSKVRARMKAEMGRRLL